MLGWSKVRADSEARKSRHAVCGCFCSINLKSNRRKTNFVQLAVLLIVFNTSK